MAGSYNHVVTDQGNLVSNEGFSGRSGAIENLGDAYEAVEEMYGMIWFLAHQPPAFAVMAPKERVEYARDHYESGLEMAKRTNRKRVT